MKGKYSNIPTSMGGRPQETPSKRMRKQPHPNGAEVARVEVPRGKMPRKMSSTPITHTPLQVTLPKMPKSLNAPPTRDPSRR